MNGLTTQAGLRIGPIVVETLAKHYFERLKQNLKLSTDTGTSVKACRRIPVAEARR